MDENIQKEKLCSIGTKTTPVQVSDGTGVLCVKLYTYSLLCVAAEQAVLRFKAVKLYDRYLFTDV